MSSSGMGLGMGMSSGGVPAPPLAVNARFASAALADREHTERRREERDAMGLGSGLGGQRASAPPPVQNSRFAAAADMDRSESGGGNRGDARGMDGGSSRFGERGGGGGGGGFNDRPQQQLVPTNDRFPSSSSSSYSSSSSFSSSRDSGSGSGSGGGGPTADDARRPGGARWGGPRDGGSAGGSAGGGDGGRWGGGGGGGGDSRPAFNSGSNFGSSSRFGSSASSAAAPPPSAAPAHGKSAPAPSAASSILAPTGPAVKVSVVIALPGETQEQAESRVAKSRADDEAKAAALADKAKALADLKVAADAKEAERLGKVSERKDELCAEFSSGKKQGKELAKWCKEQGSVLPTPEVLLYEMLRETQRKNPDTKCEWAKPEKWGTALISLTNSKVFPGAVEKDVQMQYCWAVQKYCGGLGFPKKGDEAVVVSMLKGLYKYDVAELDAQLEYMDDESEEHEDGKGKVLTQGMGWFNWLKEAAEEEEDDDDDEVDSLY